MAGKYGSLIAVNRRAPDNLYYTDYFTYGRYMDYSNNSIKLGRCCSCVFKVDWIKKRARIMKSRNM